MINRVPQLASMPAGAPPGEPFETAGPIGPCLDEERPGWFERLGNFVGDHPVMALAAGAAVGIAVGCLVKRR